MKFSLAAKISCCLVVPLALAGSTAKPNRLTLSRVAELTTPTKELLSNVFKVEISGFLPSGNGAAARSETLSAIISPEMPQARLELIREFRFPTAFAPPRYPPGVKGAGLIPTTPTAFETVDTGWTIRLTAKPEGKLVAVYGIADCVDVEMVPGGYGALAGPIYTDEGLIQSPNVLSQPRFQTTSSRFHIFAVPGEAYDVTLYRGAKGEKHRVLVTPQ